MADSSNTGSASAAALAGTEAEFQLRGGNGNGAADEPRVDANGQPLTAAEAMDEAVDQSQGFGGAAAELPTTRPELRAPPALPPARSASRGAPGGHDTPPDYGAIHPVSRA